MATEYVFPPQSYTPIDLLRLPSKHEILQEFKAKPVSTVRTPALFLDRAVVKRNCQKIGESAKKWGVKFRAHVKTHKVSGWYCTHYCLILLWPLHEWEDCRGYKTPTRMLPRQGDRRLHPSRSMGGGQGRPSQGGANRRPNMTTITCTSIGLIPDAGLVRSPTSTYKDCRSRQPARYG